MHLYGLIGYPLEHSYSADYFTEKFHREKLPDHKYRLFPLKHIDELKQLIASKPELRGLNVTIPYKQSVLQFLDETDPVASETQAVNCLRIGHYPSGLHLRGFNTDVYGFGEALKPHLKEHHKKALILGTGGSSKAVAYVLEKLHVEYLFVSRNPATGHQIGYDHLDEKKLQEYLLIINTTPLGMYPDVSGYPPLPYHLTGKNHLLFDLVYNPEKTPFLKKGEAQGADTVNGLEMFRLQAERSWQIWNE